MELNKLVEIQKEFDERHGWVPNSNDAKSIIEFAVRDLVGLFGEVGEFANIIKKIQLSHPSELDKALLEHMPNLQAELVDFMIYVVRFASYLEVDLESKYLEKLSFNEERFKKFLADKSL